MLLIIINIILIILSISSYFYHALIEVSIKSNLFTMSDNRMSECRER